MAAPSGEQCRLELYLYQANMNTSVIKIVAEKYHNSTESYDTIIHEMMGNSFKA